MPASEDYAVVVGIDDYVNDPYPRLHGAKQDARDFIAWLKSPEGGDIPDENLDPFTCLSTVDGKQPAFSHLLTLLTSLRKLAKTGKKRIGRRLYLFFSGHGVTPTEMDEAGLVTVDAQDAYTAYLPGKQSADQLCMTLRFDEIVLFMDCCRVGNLLLNAITLPWAEREDLAAARRVKRFYGFATGVGQVAREAEYNGVVRGIFSRILVDGLRGAAPPDSGGRLTTTQLRLYLETEMRKIIIDGEPLKPAFPASEEIVLAENRRVKMTVINLKVAEQPAEIEVLDGGKGFEPVVPEDLATTADGLRFSLPYGKAYAIRHRKTGKMILLKTDKDEIDAVL